MMKNALLMVAKITQALGVIVLVGTAWLLPFILLPVGDNFLLDSKVVLVFVAAVSTLLLWVLSTIAKKSLQITLSPFIGPLLLLLVAVLCSTFLNQQNVAVAQLLGFGGVYLSVVILAVIGSSLVTQKSVSFFLRLLAVPAVVSSVLTIMEVVNAGPSHLLNNVLKTQFPNNPNFNIAASPFLAAQFLTIILVGLVAHIVSHRKKLQPVLIVAAAIIAGGLVVNLDTIYKSQKDAPIFMPFGPSWSVAVDVLKTAKTAMIGVGPDNYLPAYLQLKPASVNVTPYWNLQFTQASNAPFSILTTLGLLGLVAWGGLTIQIIRQTRRSTVASFPFAAMTITSIIIELFLPLNVTILALQALILAFWVISEKNRLKDIQLHAFTVQITQAGGEVQKVPKHSNFMVYLIGALSGLLLIGMSYWVVRFIGGQYFMFRAGYAAFQNKPIDVYNYQQSAILMNPYFDMYRRSYSQTNLSIALALAGNTDKDQKESDKQQVASLIQQSIREARAATVLAPYNSVNWLNLARIYSNLIGAAEGAEGWTSAAYSEAMNTSPNDPVLRLELGALAYQQAQYKQAVELFERAVALKPDWPNAYYNLANGYRQVKDYDKAITAYEQCLALLQNTPNSAQDIEKINSELAETRKLADPDQKVTETKTNKEVPKAGPAASSSATLLAPTAASAGSQLKNSQSALNQTELENP